MTIEEEELKIKNLIKANDVISFDIFDTLLLRNIERPIDIFKLIEKKFNLPNFCNIRIQAEINSRTIENNYETTFDEIYSNINEYDANLLQKLKDEELLLEKKFLVANPFMKRIFDFCLDNNKKVFLISDMYLSKEYLTDILNNCGYKKYNNFYLSCVEKKSKGSGDLFELVKNKENLIVSKWLHIGDNINADVNIPKSKRINTYHYKNVFSRVNRLSDSISVSQSILRGIQNNYLLNHDSDYWQMFGIKNISSIYFGFVNWLFRLTKKCDNLYFFSRDGYIIKKIYEKFIKSQKCKIDCYYLYTSRYAYQLPIDVFNDKDMALDTILSKNANYGQKVSLNDIFKLINLDINDYVEELSSLGFSDDYSLSLSDKQFLVLRRFLSYIFDDIKNVMNDKVTLINKYLKQEGFYNYKKNYVMDIGWRGSIQRVIQELTKKDIFGFYFGVSNNVFSSVKNNVIGYAMNDNKSDGYGKFIDDNLMMFELIFSSPEGSLLGFKEENDKVIPILDKSSQTESFINKFQSVSIDIVDDYLKYYEYLDNCLIDDVMFDYRDFIKYRNFNDLNEFSKLFNNVGFISNKKSYVNVYSKEYIKNNFKNFWKDINQSLWRYSFLVDDIKNENEWLVYKKNYEKIVAKKLESKKSKIIKKIKNKVSNIINN